MLMGMGAVLHVLHCCTHYQIPNPVHMLSSPVSVEFITVSVTEMLSLGHEEFSVHSKVRI